MLIHFPAIWSLLAQLRSSALLYLFHEAFAQTHHLGKQDGVVREVRAKVTQHGEHVLKEVLKALNRSRSLSVPQRLQQAAFSTFRDRGSVEGKKTELDQGIA